MQAWPGKCFFPFPLGPVPFFFSTVPDLSCTLGSFPLADLSLLCCVLRAQPNSNPESGKDCFVPLRPNLILLLRSSSGPWLRSLVNSNTIVLRYNRLLRARRPDTASPSTAARHSPNLLHHSVPCIRTSTWYTTSPAAYPPFPSGHPRHCKGRTRTQSRSRKASVPCQPACRLWSISTFTQTAWVHSSAKSHRTSRISLQTDQLPRTR